MMYCPTCRRIAAEGEKYCDEDGTPLEEVAVSAVSRRGAAAPTRAATTWIAAAAGLLAGAAFGAFLLYEPSRPAQVTRALDATAPEAGSAPHMTPRAVEAAAESETETPAETPTPASAATPAVAPEPEHAPARTEALSLSASVTSGGGGATEQTVIFHLDDGVKVEADEAWKTPSGVWYRRGGVVSSLDPARIVSVERLNTQQSQAPAPVRPDTTDR